MKLNDYMQAMLTASIRNTGFGVPAAGFYPDQSLEIVLYTGGDVTETELNAMYADSQFQSSGYIGRFAQQQILTASRTLLGRLYISSFAACLKIAGDATLLRLSSVTNAMTPVANGTAGLAVINRCNSNGPASPVADNVYTRISAAFFLTVSDEAGDGELKMKSNIIDTSKTYRFNDIRLNHTIEVPVA